MSLVTITPDALHHSTAAALIASGASDPVAKAMAHAVVSAELNGIASHGLAYAPIYCEHVQCGKVDGKATPDYSALRPGTGRVDAKCGFAHPAIDVALPPLIEMAHQQGIGAVTIFNSYNCGVLGHHTERLARAGLLGLAFTNAPASIAPVGGRKPVIGTNPFSLAVPDLMNAGVAMLIDQSASVVAKSEVTARKRQGEPLPEGWALDAEGHPTTDPDAALAGSMVPAGGAKGFNAGLMTELFAAVLAGAHLGVEASPFAGTQGGPPQTGQCFFAIDPGAFGDNGFGGGLGRLLEAIAAEEGVRLPGERRLENRARAHQKGLQVDAGLLDRVKAMSAA